MCRRKDGNKKQECLSKDKRLRSEQERLLHHFCPLMSFLLPPQLDYTEAGTCDECFAKRKNVSLAGESCSCTVTFAVEKMFKVGWRFGQRANKRLILYKTQTSLVSVAVTPGRRFCVLWPQKLPPEPPQIHGLQRRHANGGQKEKFKGSSHKPYSLTVYTIKCTADTTLAFIA